MESKIFDQNLSPTHIFETQTTQDSKSKVFFKHFSSEITLIPRFAALIGPKEMRRKPKRRKTKRYS